MKVSLVKFSGGFGKAWESFRLQWHQGVRIVFSVLMSQVIARSIGLHEPYWALMTAIVVTQIRISQTFSTALDQLVGTAIGAMAGILATTLTLYGMLGKWEAFWLLLVPLAGLSAIKPSMRLAGVTLAVVFLFPSVGSPFSRPMDRVMAILVGVMSSMVVSYFVLPSNARKDALLAGDEMLDNLGILFAAIMERRMWWSDVEALNDACTLSLQKVTEAIKELRQGHPIAKLELYDPFLVKLPRILRRLQSDTIFIARALTNISTEEFEVLCKPLSEPTVAMLNRMRQLCQVEAANKVHNLRKIMLPNQKGWRVRIERFFLFFTERGKNVFRPVLPLLSFSSQPKRLKVDNTALIATLQAAYDPVRDKQESPLHFTLMIFEHDLLWLERVLRTSINREEMIG
ncbi:FUSC family protein [Entomobacter blattae]|uniref:Fusaric acid resistance protein family protein n=1 Tax=Entomobacter blattae TaxID=2762277 RepID=A0A7H1NR30_9PROT|nr:FUSC family protein [Entomobacter blattae]QNT78240.1 Fusaric acid resistance protein family protein [Entomobacter blattae]